MPPENRPLAPHLSVYKFKIHMAISISQRITGGALAFGLLAMVYWLSAAAYGPESYARAQAIFGSWFGYFCLFGWSVCLYLHLCNGIRHLFWDIGWGFGKSETMASGLAVLAGTVFLTAISWYYGLNM